ncbi:sucrose-6-phosphate hydrolase [Sarocladium strictum]
MSFYNLLFNIGLILLAAPASLATPALEKSNYRCRDYPGPPNAGLETGTLNGWQVVSGTTFGSKSVTDSKAYWAGTYNQDKKFFISGIAQAGDSATGEIKSGSFRASSFLSFLMSGGYDPERLYVGLVRERDGKLLMKQTGVNDDGLIRVTWDTSKYCGEKVHIVIHDDADWGHMNFDDLRVGKAALKNGKSLTFNTVGQANQPSPGSSSACSLYAADPMRPQYHYTPYQGWINDPAGLSQWKGKHHLFSQYYPDAPLWGPMHWAHAESTDAVHWRELPVALYPKKSDVPGDESGMFTGSAMVYDDELHLVLTNFTDTKAHPGVVQETVIVASSKDGINFDLYPDNPVVAKPPTSASPFFRDPKVFHDPTDDTWKFVIGASTGELGQVQLYESDDPFTWSNVGAMYTGDKSTDALWECPNFFPLDDKWVLIYGSNGLGRYETGTYDGKKFKSEKRGLLDAGPASYALQWYKDESGRNLGISWMGNWPTTKWPSRINGWAGQQSITREFFLREDGGLGSRPIKELDSLATGRTKQVKRQKVTKKGLKIGNTNTARVRVSADLKKTSASSFTVSLFESSAESTLLTYHTQNRTLTLDTTNAGYGQVGKWEATIAKPANNKLDLDIFLDRSVLEVFAGDGTVFSATVWPRYKESTGISAASSGGAAVFDSVSVTPLGSSWCD